jgi:putative membrane protein
MALLAGNFRSTIEGGFADRRVLGLYRASLAAVWFFYPFGIPFVAFGLLPPRFSWTGSIVIGLYALAALSSELRSHGAPASDPRALAAPGPAPRALATPVITFAVLAAALFTVEFVGVTTGVPFGHYVYTDVLGWRVAGVPVAMALAWYVTVVCTWRIAQRLVDGPAGRSRIRVALLSGVLTVILDVALEPMAAMVTRYWVWEGDAVPLENFAAWFAISFAAAWVLEGASGRREEHPGLYLNALMLFLMQWFLFALTAVAGGYAMPAAASAAGLAAVAVLFRTRLHTGPASREPLP